MFHRTKGAEGVIWLKLMLFSFRSYTFCSCFKYVRKFKIKKLQFSMETQWETIFVFVLLLAVVMDSYVDFQFTQLWSAVADLFEFIYSFIVLHNNRHRMDRIDWYICSFFILNFSFSINIFIYRWFETIDYKYRLRLFAFSLNHSNVVTEATFVLIKSQTNVVYS